MLSLALCYHYYPYTEMSQKRNGFYLFGGKNKETKQESICTSKFVASSFSNFLANLVAKRWKISPCVIFSLKLIIFSVSFFQTVFCYQNCNIFLKCGYQSDHTSIMRKKDYFCSFPFRVLFHLSVWPAVIIFIFNERMLGSYFVSCFIHFFLINFASKIRYL